jgi:hypothetical protein
MGYIGGPKVANSVITQVKFYKLDRFAEVDSSFCLQFIGV